MAKLKLPPSLRQYVFISPAFELAKEVKGIRPSPYPGFIEPSLADSWGAPPSSDHWVHEIKYDGYRAQLHHREAHDAKFFTRRGHDWAKRFAPLAAAASGLKARWAVLDGDVCLLTPEGRTDFGALQEDLGSGRTDRLVFFAFDILYLEGIDLRGAALIDRKNVTKALLPDRDGLIRYSEHLEESGEVATQMPVRWSFKASSPNDGMRSTGRPATTIGSKSPAQARYVSDRRLLAQAGKVRRHLPRTFYRAEGWNMPARSRTASLKRKRGRWSSGCGHCWCVRSNYPRR